MTDNIKTVEEIIVSSLKDIKTLFNGTSVESKVIFPNYSDASNSKRYSEQELKCIFINRLERSHSKFHYSVETPSKYKYRFVEGPKVWLLKEKPIDNYQSSMIDLSLYISNGELLSHIEFKHGQCPIFPIQKDFLKLICESDKVKNNYFVHYLDKSDKRTKVAILGKYKDSLKNIIATNENVKPIEEKLRKVYVFVLFAGLESEANFFHFSLQTLMNTEIDKMLGEHI